MNRLCGFPFDKSCVGDIDTHYQNEDKQESHIKSLAGKAAFCHACQSLNVLPDRVCGIRDKVQLVSLLHHIACGIGDIKAHCPDKVGDGVQAILNTFPDTVQPVPGQPIP